MRKGVARSPRFVVEITEEAMQDIAAQTLLLVTDYFAHLLSFPFFRKRPPRTVKGKIQR